MKTYSRENFDFVHGIRTLTGIPDDQEVKAAQDGEDWTFAQDNNKNVTRSSKPNVLGKITIPITYGHADNDYLSDCYKTDRRTKQDPYDVSIMDKFGGCEVHGEDMSIVKMPDMAFASEVGYAEWVFQGSLDMDYSESDDTEAS